MQIQFVKAQRDIGKQLNAVKLIKGEPVESFVWLPFELVTPENYKEYLTK